MDGGVVISDGETWTAPVGGGARFVVFQSDTILASYAGNMRRGDIYFPGTTQLQGTSIGGITTSLGVTSGVVSIYEIGEPGTVV